MTASSPPGPARTRKRGSAGPGDVDALPPAPLRGRLAGARYAFSSRRDGSMSAAVNDGGQHSARSRFTSAMAIDPACVRWMHQVHGREVVVMTHDPASTAGSAKTNDTPPSCDGIVCTDGTTAVAVVAADCVPVLLASPSGQQKNAQSLRAPAVAAIHAGRQGVQFGVVPQTVQALCATAGCPPESVEAVIGPAIGPCCYEVPVQMAEQIHASHPATRAQTTWGSPSLDLVSAVVSQLHDSGVLAVSRAGGCTRCTDDGAWFSHRATTGEEGRPAGNQAGVIAPHGQGGGPR